MSKNDIGEANCQACNVCEQPLGNPQFGISRQFERTIFSKNDDLDEVEVIDSNEIRAYCSSECLNKNRDLLLAQENVRASYPGIGPVESCSRCGRPVDMTRFHMAWVEDEVEIQGYEATPINAEVLAVACDQCVPPSRATQSDDIVFQLSSAPQ